MDKILCCYENYKSALESYKIAREAFLNGEFSAEDFYHERNHIYAQAYKLSLWDGCKAGFGLGSDDREALAGRKLDAFKGSTEEK